MGGMGIWASDKRSPREPLLADVLAAAQSDIDLRRKDEIRAAATL
jgi:hypothetical protein